MTRTKQAARKGLGRIIRTVDEKGNVKVTREGVTNANANGKAKGKNKGKGKKAKQQQNQENLKKEAISLIEDSSDSTNVHMLTQSQSESPPKTHSDTQSSSSSSSSSSSDSNENDVPMLIDVTEALESYEKQQIELASLSFDSDERFSHFTEQRLEVHNIIEGDRSCLVEIAYPPFWDEIQGSALKIVFPANHGTGVMIPAENDTSSTSSTTTTMIGEDELNLATAQSVSLPPAKTYPFPLDPFQKQSIACLERNQSVLVSAHTSAGKTVIAEYAIAMALRAGQRVIYTSPIKALSNQKYRELLEEFQDVGLLTGDVTINPSASCLVMTTEILRNMLYRGSEIIREVATIVYDEIHYMRNRERGVVWEETLIMLPHSVRLVFLSATLPNAAEFAMWIAKLHNQPCNVVYTDYRPTPLQHFLFPIGGEGLYMCVDEKGVFREASFQKAIAALGSVEGSAVADTDSIMGNEDGQKKKKRKTSKSSASDMYKIIRMIMEKQLAPVIVFSFSKRECESNATALAKLDFCDSEEKNLISQIIENALGSLNAEDQNLPQMQNLFPILKRGIGIHHGGLLPILKEIVELLFQEGLVKCLFSTETFSMGLNMPARTVVFTSVRKWDGTEFRVVTGGEYIQMSGRAGRRGLDDRGIVIAMMDEALEPSVAKGMLKGQSDTLNSSFYLSYNMLLNLLRVEGQNAVKMIARSFRQFQSTRKAPTLIKECKDMEEGINELKKRLGDEEGLSQYAHLLDQIENESERIRTLLLLPENIDKYLSFLNYGRLVYVKSNKPGELPWGWCMIASKEIKSVNAASKKKKRKFDDSSPIFVEIIAYALSSSLGQIKNDSPIDVVWNASINAKPATNDDDGQWTSLRIAPSLISQLSSVKLNEKKIGSQIKTQQQRNSVGAAINSALKVYSAKLPMLSPKNEMGITSDAMQSCVANLEKFSNELEACKFLTVNEIERTALLHLWDEKKDLEIQLGKKKKDLHSALQDVSLMATLRHMQAVLRKLGHTTISNVIDVKGRVAAEISTGDELVATELIFTGVFADLSVSQCVALCSCLVFNERGGDEPLRLPPELQQPLNKLQDIARRISNTMKECRLPIETDEYVDRFQPTLMQAVYAWCTGAKFIEVCKLANNVFEGSIIRCLRRLEELLRQLAAASSSIGNSTLEEKFTAGIALLKRDIVFAASLYL